MRYDSVGREIFDRKAKSSDFVNELEKFGDWFGCVPDTIFKKVLPELEKWFLAPRENHLIGMAFGARLAMKKPVVLIQNSGLGLSLDAILGTFGLYNRGLLMIVSNRGILDWEEVQHKDWGDITESLLSASNISMIDFNEEGIAGIQKAAEIAFVKQRVVALIMQRGNLDE